MISRFSTSIPLSDTVVCTLCLLTYDLPALTKNWGMCASHCHEQSHLFHSHSAGLPSACLASEFTCDGATRLPNSYACTRVLSWPVAVRVSPSPEDLPLVADSRVEDLSVEWAPQIDLHCKEIMRNAVMTSAVWRSLNAPGQPRVPRSGSRAARRARTFARSAGRACVLDWTARTCPRTRATAWPPSAPGASGKGVVYYSSSPR